MEYQLFKQMLREEWRFHSNLFGSIRFALFPIQIIAFISIAAWFLTHTDIDPTQIIVGMHGVVLLFGFQIGVVSFEGVDAIKNVLGDVTYLVFSTRTLPVSQKQLLGVFFLKDIVYYSMLFILPLAVGLYPLYTHTTMEYSLLVFTSLFASLSTMFVLGLSLPVAISSFNNRLTQLGVVVIGLASLFVGAMTFNIDLILYSPYRIYRPSSVTDLFVGGLPVGVTIGISILRYSHTTVSKPTSTQGSYRRVLTLLPGEWPLSSKMFLDLHRSSGGLVKIGGVAGSLFVIISGLLYSLQKIISTEMNIPVIYATLLSLTAYTTYEQISQYDDLDEYLFHPVSIADVFWAKHIVFAVIMGVLSSVFYMIVVLLYQPPLADIWLGAVGFVGLSVYMYGVTVFNNGFSGSEFMFDTVSFGLFSLLYLIGVLPFLLISLVSNPINIFTTVVSVWSLILLGVGVVLMWKSPSYWESYRE